jgi:phosphatidylserine/phosphatidylglycerophosphate/cardiolipin synthase-like enzyme
VNDVGVGEPIDQLGLSGVAFAERWGPARLRTTLSKVAAGISSEVLRATSHSTEYAESIDALRSAIEQSGRPRNEALALLEGIVTGYTRGASSVRAELVWSGPSTHRVPVRSTAQVLIDVIEAAEHDVLLMTYSATPYPPLLAALSAARSRDVAVTVIVETIQGAAGAIVGSEPATAFLEVPGVELWHWPAGQRTETGAKMHAKLAVADSRMLFVSSANLTQSGVAKNIEAGVLIHGGYAPARAVEHIRELRAGGTLSRLQVGEPGTVVR